MIESLKLNDQLPHLAPEVQHLVKAPRDERVAAIQEQRYIYMPSREALLRRLRDYLLRPKGFASNGGFILLGDSGIGKTELLREFQRSIDEEISDARINNQRCLVRPVMFLTLDRCSTEFDLVSALGGDMHARYLTRRFARKEIKRLVERLNQANIGMLVIDESQDFGQGSRSEQALICQDIRLIMNRLERPLVMSSTMIMHEVFAMDEHLATRFECLRIPNWSPDVELRDFILTYCQWLPLRYPPYLPNDDLDRLLSDIVTKTRSRTRAIVRLLQNAALIALDGVERIDATVLDIASQ